jgi:hypothetical protein
MAGSLLTHKNLTDELIRLSTLVVTYVKISSDAGFSDNYAALEEFAKEYFAIVENLRLTNANTIKTNYPAVDLLDDSSKVAIQVTASATRRKISETLAKWVKLNKGDYRLIVVGVTAKVNSKNATVYTLSDLVTKAKNLDLKNLQQLVKAFRERLHPNTYSLTTDAACINNLVDFLDRGALRDLQDREGDYQRMYASLEQVKRYILFGTTDHYPVSIKPLAMYDYNTKKTLRDIEYRITNILSICDRHRTISGDLVLTQNEFDQIDKLKMEIFDLVEILKNVKP